MQDERKERSRKKENVTRGPMSTKTNKVGAAARQS